MMRFPVPQFIEVEDKIVGPLTWKQFVYLAGAAGFLIILFFLVPRLIFALIGLPAAGLAGFLAFHKVNNRPFSVFLESFLYYFTHNKLYLWHREHEQEIITRTTAPGALENPVEHTQKKHLSSLARKLRLNTLQK